MSSLEACTMDKKEIALNSKEINHNAHANFRHGISDYHDGSSLTHHLGNDEYLGSNLPNETEKKEKNSIGQVALGNDFLEEID